MAAQPLKIEFDPVWGAPMVSPHPLYLGVGEPFTIKVELPAMIKMVLINFVDPDHRFFIVEGGKATGWHKEGQGKPMEEFDLPAESPLFDNVGASEIRCKYSITAVRSDDTMISLDPDIVVRR